MYWSDQNSIHVGEVDLQVGECMASHQLFHCLKHCPVLPETIAIPCRVVDECVVHLEASLTFVAAVMIEE